jgi:hypothetical protein
LGEDRPGGGAQEGGVAALTIIATTLAKQKNTVHHEEHGSTSLTTGYEHEVRSGCAKRAALKQEFANSRLQY